MPGPRVVHTKSGLEACFGRYGIARLISLARDSLWPRVATEGLMPLNSRLSELMRSLKWRVVVVRFEAEEEDEEDEEESVCSRMATAVSSQDVSMASVTRDRVIEGRLGDRLRHMGLHSSECSHCRGARGIKASWGGVVLQGNAVCWRCFWGLVNDFFGRCSTRSWMDLHGTTA